MTRVGLHNIQKGTEHQLRKNEGHPEVVMCAKYSSLVQKTE